MAFVAASLATTAMAAPAPNTRLVSCGPETCLVVTGHRASVTSRVSINDNVVAVEGGRSWRVRLPLATVRAWSAPFARSIAVAVAQPDGLVEASTEAELPIGLLGHRTDLAALVVRAR
ncbi:MAG TPA: hypothetical protein VF503_26070 [Sphingobium sp.]|uniref:hypothetical protein n=1 Tax=Sphingobium sp. TaxID=1912891 RepID=UPI002ED5C859